MNRIFVGGQNSSGRVFGSQGDGLRPHIASKFDLIEDIQDLMPSDLYVALDMNVAELRTLNHLGLPRQNRALVAFEPTVVLPWQTSENAHEQFDFIRWVGRGLDARCNERWPQILDLASPGIEKSVELTLIASNKLSFVPGELYSLRRQVVRELDGIALIGSSWNAALSSRVFDFSREWVRHLSVTKKIPKGNLDFFVTTKPSQTVYSKMDWLIKCEVAIVVENSLEYTSEKPYDALRALVKPIYVGPRGTLPGEIEDLIFYADPNMSSIKEAIRQAKQVDRNEWEHKVTAVLGSPEILTQLGEESVFSRISQEIWEWSKLIR